MIKLSDWESSFFSKRIGSISYDDLCVLVDNREFNKYAKGFDLVTLEMPLRELTPAKGKHISTFGFFLADSKADFKFKLISRNNWQNSNLDLAKNENYSSLREFSKGLFKDSRFYYPPFSVAEGEAFFAQWLHNAILGEFDDYCFFSQDSGKIQGFVTSRLDLVEKRIRIGLIGTDAKTRGLGLGKRLFNFIYKNGFESGAEHLFVATQVRNQQAMGFYSHLGGVIDEITQIFYFSPTLER